MYALLISTALLLPASTTPPSPAAMVLATKGNVTLTRSHEQPRRLDTMDLVRPGDRLRATGNDQATLVFLDDGHRERLVPAARVTVTKNGCLPAAAVERLMSTHNLSPTQLASLRELAQSSHAGVGVLRGDSPPTPQPVIPMYGATVLALRPALSWPALAGAESYQVELLRGNEQALVWRTETREAHLAYLGAEPSLHPAAKYLWRVTAHLDSGKDRVIVNSKFLTATTTEAKELARLRPLAASADAGDMLLAATTYEAHGVYDQAMSLYERLAKKDPNSAAIQSALASYYDRAGHSEQARAARQRADKLHSF